MKRYELEIITNMAKDLKKESLEYKKRSEFLKRNFAEITSVNKCDKAISSLDELINEINLFLEKLNQFEYIINLVRKANKDELLSGFQDCDILITELQSLKNNVEKRKNVINFLNSSAVKGFDKISDENFRKILINIFEKTSSYLFEVSNNVITSVSIRSDVDSKEIEKDLTCLKNFDPNDLIK